MVPYPPKALGLLIAKVDRFIWSTSGFASFSFFHSVFLDEVANTQQRDEWATALSNLPLVTLLQVCVGVDLIISGVPSTLAHSISELPQAN